MTTEPVITIKLLNEIAQDKKYIDGLIELINEYDPDKSWTEQRDFRSRIIDLISDIFDRVKKRSK